MSSFCSAENVSKNSNIFLFVFLARLNNYNEKKTGKDFAIDKKTVGVGL